jgi:Cyclo-malto-dextrinase C-terminal domain
MTTKISLFFCSIIALSGLRAQQPVRVEPASWWVDTAILSGKFIHFASEKGIYAYSRYDSKQKFLVILNQPNPNH